MTTDHTSKDFDHALGRARELVILMAARVERQLADAIESLQTGSPALIAQILRHEAEVNGLERAIDEISGQIIARRHPDEAKKIALYARSIFAAGRQVLPRVLELRPMAELVDDMLRQATRAMEALDPNAAAVLVRRDLEVNERFRAVLARLAGFMVEDPRSISACLDILFVAKSFERIGDHAKNLGEHVVYATTEKDVRHATAQEIEQVVRS